MLACVAAARRDSQHSRDVHVEALVPVGVQRLLDDAGRARLLAIDRGHGEGVRESCAAPVSGMSRSLTAAAPTEHIALVEAIGGNNYAVSVPLLELRAAHRRGRTHW
jgi:hypothetical protein